MYKVFAFATPNSVKVPIFLEELGLEYDLHSVNVKKGEQKSAAFLALNSNGKVPVLQNTTDGFVLTESAAILVHLAEKHEKLLSRDPIERARTFEQLFFHASGLSPAFGQSGFFQKMAAEPQPIAIARFDGEAKRILAVLNGVLGKSPYSAGEHFSIADIAHFGWIWRRAFANIDFADSPNVARWYESVLSRPAVLRAIARVESLVPKL